MDTSVDKLKVNKKEHQALISLTLSPLMVSMLMVFLSH